MVFPVVDILRAQKKYSPSGFNEMLSKMSLEWFSLFSDFQWEKKIYSPSGVKEMLSKMFSHGFSRCTMGKKKYNEEKTRLLMSKKYNGAKHDSEAKTRLMK